MQFFTPPIVTSLADALEPIKPASFSLPLFQSLLKTDVLGRSIIYRITCPSTQELAVRENVEGAVSGTIVLSEEQTKGRGRIELRNWLSPSRKNIYCSLLLRPQLPTLAAHVSFASAIAIARAIGQFLPKPDCVRVKWPNDVWIDTKKVAGILVDGELMGNQMSLIVGFGINVYQDFTQIPDSDLSNSATSVLSAALQQNVPITTISEQLCREKLLASVCNELHSLLETSWESLLEQYIALDLLVGKEVVVMPKRVEGDEKWHGKAIGFTKDGFLQVSKEDGSTQLLVSEEVSIRPLV